jgi:hypothetical protein
MFLVTVLTSQIIQAQGTTYLSNLSQPSAGSLSVGSDSWLAFSFATGSNTSGYTLNSLQLGMADASGNPSGFMVMLYSAIGQFDRLPQSSIGTPNGSLNPASSGIYTYEPASSMTLSPNTVYFIVLTSGTTVADGAYNWNYSGSLYGPSGGWRAPFGGFTDDNFQSSDGLNWNVLALVGFPQFAINATPIPEPSVGIFLSLGGILLLGISRWKAKVV